MNKVDPSTRSPFFPKGNSGAIKNKSTQDVGQVSRNSYEKAQQINSQTARDARVDIPEAVKDFSRIKAAVDNAPEVDNSDKVARLRAQIQAGTYQVDYDALADKILESEF
jgi:negative regulator of flagellin synthesis FlgM